MASRQKLSPRADVAGGEMNSMTAQRTQQMSSSIFYKLLELDADGEEDPEFDDTVHDLRLN